MRTYIHTPDTLHCAVSQVSEQHVGLQGIRSLHRLQQHLSFGRLPCHCLSMAVMAACMRSCPCNKYLLRAQLCVNSKSAAGAKPLSVVRPLKCRVMSSDPAQVHPRMCLAVVTDTVYVSTQQCVFSTKRKTPHGDVSLQTRRMARCFRSREFLSMNYSG